MRPRSDGDWRQLRTRRGWEVLRRSLTRREATMYEWRAEFEAKVKEGWEPLKARLVVRAVTAEKARELAPIVFEQTYHQTPDRLGFELVALTGPIGDELP